ncbi:MAG: epoxide hydrolase, soluble (sEH) [Bogoriella megaspora]|nr:MAG: epoxide hydrolase, soluble (sEH) [Bogoriella megaspora]
MAVIFDHGHQDLVLAVDYNFYGTRMATASSDHTIRVWERHADSWEPLDSWKAHDAEVTDVKWNGPFTGDVLASVGEDGVFKVWEEDVLEQPNSHKRFRRVYQMWTPTRIPFMSLDFKNLGGDTLLALITRDAYLMLCEPVDSSDFRDWKILTQLYICASPPRTEESSFRVNFHHEKLPGWHALEAGLDKKSVGLAVAAMDKVTVFRTDRDRQLYVAAELTGARSLVRDVAWANGAMRGFDVIATASKDGAVRVYEITTPLPPDVPGSRLERSSSGLRPTDSSKTKEGKKPQSGIGASLSSASQGSVAPSPSESGGDAGRVKHDVKLVSELRAHEGAVWRVAFSAMGDVLASSGDDGKIRLWKRAWDSTKGVAEWLEHTVIATRP